MSVHPSQIERSVSRLNETAYLTPRANSDDFLRIISSDIQLADENLGWADDAGYDHGSDVPTDKWMTTVGHGVPFSPDFNFQDIGYFLKDFLGSYAVTGSTAPYIHTFTPQSMNTSRQMPSRTYLEKVGAIDLTRFTSIVGTRLVISSGKVDRLKVQAQYEGSGKQDVDPAGYTSPAVLAGREFAYASQAFFRLNDNDDGTSQVETATGVGTASSSGDITVTITAAGLTGSPIAVTVAITSGDVPNVWVPKVRAALRNSLVISNFFDISGATDKIVLTTRLRSANDATMNIAIAAGSTGITAAPTSTDTTAGVVGDTQAYTCAIQNWALSIDLPPADPGYNSCGAYVIDGQPRSGQIRSEFLVGARRIMFTYGVKLLTGDKTRDWMRNGTDVTLEIPIVGVDSGNSSLRITHTRGIIDGAKRTPNLNGFVGINGSVDLMSNSGSFPLTAVLMNDVASYAS